ncbi:ladderlectin-like [Hoplias malabaricus]|uniref:ladderlectin-like n=1 Tax=Hoplias malabaricus TaxID=27720 RepID=UPI003462D3D8
MNTVILLCLVCISFTHGAPAAELEPVIQDVGEDAGPANFVYCPTGWFQYGSRCFLLVTSRMTWLNAENHCVSLQGALASVQSPGEHHFLQNLANLGGQASVWIGAYNFQNQWMWIDRAGFFYNSWQSLSSTSSNPCGYMRSNAGWTNTVCTSILPFFCVKVPQC